MNVARLNFSHGTRAEQADRYYGVRAAADAAGLFLIGIRPDTAGQSEEDAR